MLKGELEGEALEKYVEESVLTTTLDKAAQLGRRERDLPGHVRARLLRDRDDVDRRRARRRRALRRRGVPRLPAPGRSADPLRPRVDQDGAGRPPDLRPDDRAALGDRDGRLLVVDGRLQQLRDRAGRQVHAGRRPRARLPAAARGADARHPQAARDDPGQARPELAHPLRRPRHRGVRRVRARHRAGRRPRDRRLRRRRMGTSA